MRVIDLTHTIKENMPVYPGTGTPKLETANTYEENGIRETLVSFYPHTGTHMDPPAHLFAGRTTLDAFPASQFLGRALVIDCTHLRGGEAITMKELRKYGGLEDTVDFLLFYLRDPAPRRHLPGGGERRRSEQPGLHLEPGRRGSHQQ